MDIDELTASLRISSLTEEEHREPRDPKSKEKQTNKTKILVACFLATAVLLLACLLIAYVVLYRK